MKIGIIHDTREKGRGGHGLHLAFRGLPGADIAALADSNIDDAGTRLAETGARRHYPDWREMLDRERPDIVVLPSRLPGERLEPIRIAVARGCHVLSEKPLFATLEDADGIVGASRARGVKIAVAHLARHARLFRVLKRMIGEGAVGRPLTFYGRGKEDGRGGGEDMAVLGVHILDLGNFLFGAPRRVYAEVLAEGRPIRAGERAVTSEPVGPVAGDEIFATWRYPDGVRGVFESRRGLFRGTVRMGVAVAGTEGCLAMRYDEGERCLRWSRSPLPPEDESRFEAVPPGEDDAIPGAEPLGDFPRYLPYFLVNNRLAAWDLLRAVATDTQPAANAEDARLALEMQMAVYRSQLEGRAVDLPLSNRKHPLED